MNLPDVKLPTLHWLGHGSMLEDIRLALQSHHLGAVLNACSAAVLEDLDLSRQSRCCLCAATPVTRRAVYGDIL